MGGSGDHGGDPVHGFAGGDDRRRDLGRRQQDRANRAIFPDPSGGLPRVGSALPAGHDLALRVLRRLLVRPLLVIRYSGRRPARCTGYHWKLPNAPQGAFALSDATPPISAPTRVHG
jgi:hypothetical protein